MAERVKNIGCQETKETHPQLQYYHFLFLNMEKKGKIKILFCEKNVYSSVISALVLYILLAVGIKYKYRTLELNF